MKALVRVSNDPKSFQIQELPEPSPNAGEVKIKVEYAGICGTDLHMYLGAFTDLSLPLILGHEFSGTIVEIGTGVEGWQIGDKVTAEHTFQVCGICDHCQIGNYHLCSQRYSLGFERPGCFAEFTIASAKYLHKLPPNVTLAEGAMTEPLACALHAVELVKPQPGERVLVVGPGPIGLLTGICLMGYNCQVDIIGMKEDALRLEKARELKMNVIESITSGSYDLVAECSGSQGGVNVGLDAVRKNGKFLQVGIAAKPITVDFDTVVFKELQIQGTFCHHWPTWKRALELEEIGLLDTKPLISETVAITNWQEAFEKLLNKEAIKILLKL